MIKNWRLFFLLLHCHGNDVLICGHKVVWRNVGCSQRRARPWLPTLLRRGWSGRNFCINGFWIVTCCLVYTLCHVSKGQLIVFYQLGHDAPNTGWIIAVTSPESKAFWLEETSFVRQYNHSLLWGRQRSVNLRSDLRTRWILTPCKMCVSKTTHKSSDLSKHSRLHFKSLFMPVFSSLFVELSLSHLEGRGVWQNEEKKTFNWM